MSCLTDSNPPKVSEKARFGLKNRPKSPGKPVEEPEAGVMTIALVLVPWVAESNDDPDWIAAIVQSASTR